MVYNISIPEKNELINKDKTEAIENKKNEQFGLNLSSFLCLDSICLNPENYSIPREKKLQEWEEDGTIIYAAGNMGGILNLIFWSVKPDDS